LFTLRRASEDTILSIQPITVFIEVLHVVRGVPVCVVAGGGVVCRRFQRATRRAGAGDSVLGYRRRVGDGGRTSFGSALEVTVSG
jgi:uridylate kinase